MAVPHSTLSGVNEGLFDAVMELWESILPSLWWSTDNVNPFTDNVTIVEEDSLPPLSPIGGWVGGRVSLAVYVHSHLPSQVSILNVYYN